ncbi:stage III sporulation protein AF [Thermanaeromonas toyohensis ToBE]|uniref:Stage III sporulation protein AF n=1 Tax=Thermanaeromonas toyohensis ToBE TaxID=698762 RepID=A0A1W1VZ21_9FIRM|nr:stage III sporulation protein AF [Thermanaeromonas toyohensis]SMB98586.1 stage III sporulation protein AF [Thermanaeromonas toyohensis ToBE]
MLEVIGEIVHQVALIALLAGLMEMLLPQQALSKYVRLVLGLFVIVAILSPLAASFSRGKTLEVISWDLRPDTREEGFKVSQGALTRIEEETALEIFRKRLSSQMRALLALIPGVEDTQVQVEMEPGNPRNTKIRRVHVTAVLGRETRPEEVETRIRQTLAYFYGVEPGAVDIYKLPKE